MNAQKNSHANPFMFEGAIDLPRAQLASYFVTSSAHRTILTSPRNVFILGNRGSGKSMTLLYYSLQTSLAALVDDKKIQLDNIGIYVPCNNTLHMKEEYSNDDPVVQSAISEHNLVLSTLFYLAEELNAIGHLWSTKDKHQFRSELSYLLRKRVPKNKHPISWLLLFCDRYADETQNAPKKSSSVKLMTFHTSLLPILRALCRTSIFENSVFSLLYDDAHVMSQYAQETLNSWIAFRGFRNLNFKVAIAKSIDYSWLTKSKGSILIGHDYAKIDLEEPFQSKNTEYFQWSKQVIETRLRTFGITASPEDYFPENKRVRKAIDNKIEEVRLQAERDFPNKSKKSLQDYVYKHGRAEYFRRQPKSNKPKYSGFEVLVAFSTGIIRNLLQPCYTAFNQAYSRSIKNGIPKVIPANIQDKAIKAMSHDLWWDLKHIENKITGCKKGDGQKLRYLYNCLARLLEYRLKHHKSEPRTLGCTLSGTDQEGKVEIKRILRIAMEAQLLYVRPYAGKDAGTFDTLYMPNRLLWAIYGFDPVGQHGRVTLKISEVLAAMKGKDFSQVKSAIISTEPELFNE